MINERDANELNICSSANFLLQGALLPILNVCCPSTYHVIAVGSLITVRGLQLLLYIKLAHVLLRCVSTTSACFQLIKIKSCNGDEGNFRFQIVGRFSNSKVRKNELPCIWINKILVMEVGEGEKSFLFFSSVCKTYDKYEIQFFI